MTIKTLPAAPEGRPCARVTGDILPQALERWDGGIRASFAADNTISIFDVIGQDYWGEGVTAKRIGAALRSIGGDDVVVYINSPGGDMFEGLTIYNLLREYKGKIIVKVLGLAASAASVIAMAGDEIQIGRGAFFMIHNCWITACGNRNELAKIAADMEPFDRAARDIYSARSGVNADAVAEMMDNETFIGGSEAVETGFADLLLSADQIASADESPEAAIRKLDALLAKVNTPRAERRRLIRSLTGSRPSAAAEQDGTPGATSEINTEELASLQAAVNSLAAACHK